MNSHEQEMKKCIEACERCHNSCLETMQYCLERGGKHAAEDHISTLRDCAEICQTNANFMLTGSPFHRETCAICADVCKTCEESCEAFLGDERMKQCAEACRACGDSCDAMAGRRAAA